MSLVSKEYIFVDTNYGCTFIPSNGKIEINLDQIYATSENQIATLTLIDCTTLVPRNAFYHYDGSRIVEYLLCHEICAVPFGHSQKQILGKIFFAGNGGFEVFDSNDIRHKICTNPLNKIHLSICSATDEPISLPTGTRITLTLLYERFSTM